MVLPVLVEALQCPLFISLLLLTLLLELIYIFMVHLVVFLHLPFMQVLLLFLLVLLVLQLVVVTMVLMVAALVVVVVVVVVAAAAVAAAAAAAALVVVVVAAAAAAAAILVDMAYAPNGTAKEKADLHLCFITCYLGELGESATLEMRVPCLVVKVHSNLKGRCLRCLHPRRRRRHVHQPLPFKQSKLLVHRRLLIPKVIRAVIRLSCVVNPAGMRSMRVESRL